MDGTADKCLSNTPVVTEASTSDIPISIEDERDVFEPNRISLMSVVYIGSETWVTDFDKLDVLKRIMERLPIIESPALQDPSLDDICAGKDPTDGRWYRVKIMALEPAVQVHYIDFGNEGEICIDSLAVLPDELKIEPPLARKVSLKWDKSCSPLAPSVGDVLEVKYDGKEADGTLKLEVVGIKGISDPDESLSDDGKSDENLFNDLPNHSQEADLDHKEGGCSAVQEEFEPSSVSVEVETLREEAHSTVQEILKKFDEELPKTDEVALQTRLEVEKTKKEMLPLEEEVAHQSQLQVQKKLQVLEGLQKQQEAALASMRQMMEQALSQSLSKIDRIQKDLHKLYRNQSGLQGANQADVAYQRNQYQRPMNAALHDFSPDRRHHKYGEDSSGGGNASLRLGMRDSRALPYGQATVHSTNQGAHQGVNQSSNHAANQSNSRRSVSLRLRQAGDYNVVTTTILSVNNLPEMFTCDYLCTLFGLYGNLLRAKMLFNQKGKALVEMADAAQAAATTKMLDGTVIFGQAIHVRASTFEKLNISPTELTNNTAKDNTRLNSYQANAVRRFKKGFWDPARLVAPSETLRVSNILKTVPDDNVRAAFIDKGFQFKSIHFSPGAADKKTAYVVFNSIDDAFRALHMLHNTELSDWMPMKISFGVTKKE